MKVYKSIKQTRPIEELPKSRVRITCSGEDPEGVWVAKDDEVQFLLNHALMFYPVPSWGMELPPGEDLDLYRYRGDTLDSVTMTVCEEMYSELEKYIREDDEFDFEAYLKRPG